MQTILSACAWSRACCASAPTMVSPALLMPVLLTHQGRLTCALSAVTCCTNGRAALAKLREHPQGYDVVLSDVYMPGQLQALLQPQR